MNPKRRTSMTAGPTLTNEPPQWGRLSVFRTFSAARVLDWRSVGVVSGLMLCGELAVLQAPMFDGLSLDPFALVDDDLGLAEASEDVTFSRLARLRVGNL